MNGGRCEAGRECAVCYGMAEAKEPQSYGSQAEWVRGDTAQEVNRQKGHPNSQRGDFYAELEKGDSVSPEQAAENQQPVGAAGDDHTPVNKVTDRRGGYFRKRDYK